MSLLHVFDLPQLYTKPSAHALLHALGLLTSAPPSWECSDVENHDPDEHGLGRRKGNQSSLQIGPEGVTRYLTSIVSSSLQWIEDEEAREEVWNQASMRLSERSGRTAMGAISRQFRIPSPSGLFNLTIHEPALTADNLGLKTWAASYLLAKRLHIFGIVKECRPNSPRVLELGSGTGLVGLAMACLGADVLLTDLPSIYPNLAHNVLKNHDVVRQNNGSTLSGVLDWTNPTSLCIFPQGTPDSDGVGVPVQTKFPVILAADSLYSSDHPRLLVDTIEAWLSEHEEAKVIVEFPLRDAYLPEIKDFRDRMKRIGLFIQEEGEEKGYDDWGWTGAGDDGSDSGLVHCWWSSWGRTTRKTN
ncbi:uncharacterized protein BDR25DRAFT_28534 [Lindgomyces ingoldianus]|uniref:Uncharacterized protein n=1 Tax=Lindgomyces ingoldianus TaxID=673940 RepID=A0ACB6QVT9_9PLEO|nr:uncharacterized protein BDR25DRAFT_28534 [Lindgomyces ingoldianus]KAF2470957.1 hypothetical protein BDR25DRAFT_28534 [Lindgomyces ingoldianus]